MILSTVVVIAVGRHFDYQQAMRCHDYSNVSGLIMPAAAAASFNDTVTTLISDDFAAYFE